MRIISDQEWPGDGHPEDRGPRIFSFFLNNFFAFLAFLSAQPPRQYSTSTAVLDSLGFGAIVIRAREALQVALHKAIGQRDIRRLKGTCN